MVEKFRSRMAAFSWLAYNYRRRNSVLGHVSGVSAGWLPGLAWPVAVRGLEEPLFFDFAQEWPRGRK
jgi:hypothetical protein